MWSDHTNSELFGDIEEFLGSLSSPEHDGIGQAVEVIE
jgi:hypothetical protein